MATDARISGGPTTYAVEVSGSWFDPVARTETEQTQTFNVLALAPAHAEYAGMQLFVSAAAAERCIVQGDRSARIGALQ